jgi:integrase
MKIITPDQVHELAEAIDPRYRVMVLTAAYTGLRWGETAGLQLPNIDFLRRSLRVTGTLVEVSGQVSLGPPKTKRSARKLSISRTLADEIGVHIGRYPDSDGWIFPAPEGGPIRATNWRRRVWAPAVSAAGLEPMRFHDLRHTHASMLIAQGEHPKVIAERLGHSSITVTLDVYGHLMPGMDERVADRLEILMRGELAAPTA